MDNSNFIWIAVACIAGVFALLMFTGGDIQVSEGGIPPTNAYDQVRTQTDNKTTSAISSGDTLFVRGVGIDVNQFIPAQIGWCDANYDYRKTITIASSQVSNTNQTDFPFMFNGTFTDIESVARSDGNDIIFCDENDNQLNHDLDEWESGHLLAWVNVPNVYENIDTDLFVYYGNANEASATENEDATWGDNYQFVHHYNNELLDSSGNNNHALQDWGVACYKEDSEWGTGYYGYLSGCAGVSRLALTNNLYDEMPFTQSYTVVANLGQRVSSGSWGLLLEVDIGTPETKFAGDQGGNSAMSRQDNSTNIIARYDGSLTDSPHNLIYTYNGGGDETDLIIYRDAISSMTTSVAGTLIGDITTDTTWYIGDSSRVDRLYWGTMGELQYYNGHWDADKSMTVSENYFDPSSFYSVGAELQNPSISFVPNRAIEFSLNVPTSTILGGVLAGDCASGDFVTGINTTDGGLLCDTP